MLFYVFFEAMLLPMYFLIALWGGERREYAAMKFLLYTLFGSVVHPGGDPGPLLLAGRRPAVLDGRAFEGHTFDCRPGRPGRVGDRVLRPVDPALDLRCSCVGFCVKLPSFPFHTWLPDAHVEAPTPISMVLAGVLLKVGGYGLIRLAWPLAPLGAPGLGLAGRGARGRSGILYGALVALAQTDFKKLVAYSSISHMGYVTLGMAALSRGRDPRFYAFGLDGAMFMMLAHGITSTGMFFLVGVIYERTATRDLRALGGLAQAMPGPAWRSVVFFGSMGLPGLCGFVAEVFVILAAFHFSPALGGLGRVRGRACGRLHPLGDPPGFLGTDPSTPSWPTWTAGSWRSSPPWSC